MDSSLHYTTHCIMRSIMKTWYWQQMTVWGMFFLAQCVAVCRSFVGFLSKYYLFESELGLPKEHYWKRARLQSTTQILPILIILWLSSISSTALFALLSYYDLMEFADFTKNCETSNQIKCLNFWLQSMQIYITNTELRFIVNHFHQEIKEQSNHTLIIIYYYI